MFAEERFVAIETELAYYKALVVELQWKLDQKEQILQSYENMTREALVKLGHITKGVHDAATK